MFFNIHDWLKEIDAYKIDSTVNFPTGCVLNPDVVGYDENNANFMLWITSKATETSCPQSPSTAFSFQNWQQLQWKAPLEIHLTPCGWMCTTTINGKQIGIITLRGTSGLAEWLSDINSDPITNGIFTDVHSGFFGLYQSMQTQVQSFVKQYGNLPIFVSGHSLGAGVASLLAYDLIQSCDQINCHVFGAPRAGGVAFVNNFIQSATKPQKKLTLVRLVNSEDIVPELAFPFEGIYKNAKGFYYAHLPSTPSALNGSLSSSIIAPLFTNSKGNPGQNHCLATYQAGVKMLNPKILAFEEKSDIKLEADKLKAPVSMSGAPASSAAPQEPASFDVILKSYEASKKINMIKVVRANTGLGLAEAKALVESAPKSIKSGLDKVDADALAKEIQDAGGSAEIK